MSTRTIDGSAGDADCGRIGTDYRTYRQPEPEVIATEARRYPTPARLASGLGGTTEVVSVPIPAGLCRRILWD